MAANAIFVFPHKTSALGIYVPTRRCDGQEFKIGLSAVGNNAYLALLYGISGANGAGNRNSNVDSRPRAGIEPAPVAQRATCHVLTTTRPEPASQTATGQ
ncbi:hypothetical protein Bbelb_316540 [Branchiostoma belcheri]|nr:hypothetical protein Bbelb_316540 [Branchiostoma belcheri]